MIDKLIDQINEIEQKILSSDNNGAVNDIISFSRNLNDFLPIVFSKYMLPEFSKHKEDIGAWINQVKRLSEAINSNDHLFILDVLCFEIRENLKEVKNTLLKENL